MRNLHQMRFLQVLQIRVFNSVTVNIWALSSELLIASLARCQYYLSPS